MLNPNMKFLVVDDFAAMRRIIRSLLKQLGFTNVQEADDGSSALPCLHADDTFELVVSDWSMPKMSGIDLLRAIRADAQLKHLPFLMVLPDGTHENISKLEQAGANGYIVKPFTSVTLQAKLDEIFQKMNK